MRQLIEQRLRNCYKCAVEKQAKIPSGIVDLHNPSLCIASSSYGHPSALVCRSTVCNEPRSLALWNGVRISKSRDFAVRDNHADGACTHAVINICALSTGSPETRPTPLLLWGKIKGGIRSTSLSSLHSKEGAWEGSEANDFFTISLYTFSYWKVASCELCTLILQHFLLWWEVENNSPRKLLKSGPKEWREY